MKRNGTLTTDVIAGVALALVMVVPYLHFFHGASEIAAGRFGVGGDLTGIYPTDMPASLKSGPGLFMFGLPAIAVYVIWMLTHRFGRFWTVAGMLLAIPVAAFVGFGAFAEAWLSPEEWLLANVSLGAIAVCLFLVAAELLLHRLTRPPAVPAVSAVDLRQDGS